MIDELAEHGYGDMKYAASGLHPFAVVLTLLGMLQICFLPRKHVAAALLMVAILIPFEQQVIVAGLHFTMARIMIACAALRILVKGEHREISMNIFDKIFIGYVVSTCVVFILQWRSFDAVINRSGFAYTALGLYGIARLLIRDLDDVRHLLHALCVIMLVVAGCMVLEGATGRNLFAIFGGVPEFTEIREDRLRCQAAFAHPILAGSFGATSIPLLLSFWFSENRRERRFMLIGALSAVIVVLESASSGPLMAMLAGLFAVIMWRWREKLGTLLCVIVWTLVILHLFIMKASVWALIWRASAFAGSTGYHRFALVDNFITRFEDWWMLGLRSTDYWTGDEQLWDIADEFVAVGVNGGIWAFALFVAALTMAFKGVGAAVRSDNALAPQDRFTYWCIGSALFAHCVGFIGICYFDQMQVIWYFLLGILGGVYNAFATVRQDNRGTNVIWLKPVLYTIIIMLAARLTAHETRLLF